MPRRQPTEVIARLRFSDAEGQLERLAQQLGGLLERHCVRRIVVLHRLPFSECGSRSTRGGQTAVSPPSTDNVAPWMFAALSLTRNATAAATCSGVLGR